MIHERSKGCGKRGEIWWIANEAAERDSQPWLIWSPLKLSKAPIFIFYSIALLSFRIIVEWIEVEALVNYIQATTGYLCFVKKVGQRNNPVLCISLVDSAWWSFKRETKNYERKNPRLPLLTLPVPFYSIYTSFRESRMKGAVIDSAGLIMFQARTKRVWIRRYITISILSLPVSGTRVREEVTYTAEGKAKQTSPREL